MPIFELLCNTDSFYLPAGEIARDRVGESRSAQSLQAAHLHYSSILRNLVKAHGPQIAEITLAATTMCRFCRLGKPRVEVASRCLLKQVTPVTRSPMARATSSCTLLSCNLHGKYIYSWAINRMDLQAMVVILRRGGRGGLLFLSDSGFATPDPEQTLHTSSGTISQNSLLISNRLLIKPANPANLSPKPLAPLGLSKATWFFLTQSGVILSKTLPPEGKI